VTPKKIHIQIILLWLFLVVLGLNGRSYLPIDETRYVTVAWNMWLNGDYLVPYLNGVAYSHKPPLLFWLINLGWKIFGVNDWWPRLVPSLFALGSVFFTRKIAGRLWPEQITIKDNASLILIDSGLWVLYSTALMFDMMIAFFTALGIWGLLIALQASDKNSGKKGWLLFTLAIGGGLLAKGPTILLQLLPVALLAAWWNINPTKKLNAKNWYLPLFYAVLGGAAIALIWAIPAGIHGGQVYQHAIFWGQTANRMVDSFAHNRPFWWYAPILPLLLFPWLLWGRFWQGIKLHKTPEFGIRFCIAWALPVFIAFSFISGKQIHYILPIFPAFALLIARFSHINDTENKRTFVLPIAIAIALLGAILLAFPLQQRAHPSAALWIQDIPLWLGGLIIASAFLIYFLPKKSVANTVAQLSVMTIGLVSICMFVLISAAGDAYDVRPISAQLKILELSNTPVAYVGKYPGIFNFVGRLKQSPDLIDAGGITAWFAAHPNGRIVEYFNRDKPIDPSQVEYIQAYKGISVAILSQAQWQTISNKLSTTQAD
jgi:4-amino-4-deoxy-L-arabinose transferase-like glycosyltransferase